MITIDGSQADEDVVITGNTKANIITGGTGADTLNGGAGKDFITDYSTTEGDKLSIGGGVSSIVNATYNTDGDLVLTVNKQNLTIQGESLQGAQITINDTGYVFDTNKIFDAEQTAVTMYSAFKGAFDATEYSALKVIDGAINSVAGTMNITGNDLGNTISGGKKADTIQGGTGADSINGGAGNDSIIGGKGNDYLYGGAGKDVFVYNDGDGNDTIQDYTAGQDKIRINADYDTLVSGNSVIFSVGSGQITVKDFFTLNTSNHKITVIDASGKSKSIAFEQSNSDVFDLFEDNNFITDDPGIDDVSAISDTKYSVGDVKTSSYSDLTQPQDLLTYGNDDDKK